MERYSARARQSSRADALVPASHPSASLPRRRLATLRPGAVVEGVVTRLVRGGALVDVQLESNEPAFAPLTEIPAKAMPVVRELIASGAMQQVRVVQVDRMQGTAIVSFHGMVKLPEEPGTSSVKVVVAKEAAGTGKPKLTASERAKNQQQALLKRLRSGDL